MKLSHAALPSLTLITLLAACGGSSKEPSKTEAPATGTAASAAAPAAEEDHEHDEVALGTVTIGEHAVACAQGHGAVEAGEEGHLVVKLPYTDQGSTVVRAWIGTSDRTLSFVGKGDYAAAHDDYDVHATAPDPLPADVKWWIEIETPDGEAVVGSITPLLE